jgi:hypothetical protein
MAGPLVVGRWAVPPPLAKYLVSNGLPVPAPVEGHMLVDTGATRTCIALDVAERDLSLQPTSIAHTYGAGGLHESKIFFVEFRLQIIDGKRHSQISNVMQAAGIPEMDASAAKLGLADGDGHPLRLIGLLGRDFLGHVTMTYRGVSGRVEFQIHHDSMRPAQPGV